MALDLRPRHLFTTDEYFRMVESGILSKDDRVELIEGEIVEMPPIGSYHAGIVNRFVKLFKAVVDSEAILAFQNPVQLKVDSAPQPDVAVLRLRDDYYTTSHPTGEDVLLLIEIADSSLVFDQRVKAPLYSDARVHELWIVNLATSTVEVHKEPSEAGYLVNAIARRGESLSPSALPNIVISVDEILG
jgi:Uma2 family endonuclease